MANKRMLEQQWDDYTSMAGEYAAGADFYNYHFDRAMAREEEYLVPSDKDGKYYVSKGAKGDSLDVHKEKPNSLPKDGPTVTGPDGLTYHATWPQVGFDVDGNRYAVDHAWASDPNVTAQQLNERGWYAILPDRPDIPEAVEPSFTKAEYNALMSPDPSASRAERTADSNMMRKAGVPDWSPLSDGAGILQRVLKGKI
jgi:hypothetical protein